MRLSHILLVTSSAALVACPTAHPLGAIQSAPSGHSSLRTDKGSQANNGSPPPSGTEARMEMEWLVRLLECLPFDMRSVFGLQAARSSGNMPPLVALHDMPENVLRALEPAIKHYKLDAPLSVEPRPLHGHDGLPAHSPDEPTPLLGHDGLSVHSPNEPKPLLGYTGTPKLKAVDAEIERIVAESDLKRRAAIEEVKAANDELVEAEQAVSRAKGGAEKDAATNELEKAKQASDVATRKLMRLGGAGLTPEAAYAKVQDKQTFETYVAMIMANWTPEKVLGTRLDPNKVGLYGDDLKTAKDLLYRSYNDFYKTLDGMGVVERLLRLSKEKSPPAVPSE
ncbi:unnamed protein product [Hyaloperonospora brassicae]|uniref:RxLR effector candidate protein n=1 Tax=Hyaloperonospora brassicae TaxID=162125 RepID=A0AAV0TQH1_HYABA|nr:unnamed protein product [Hyaloperonospora brassicae]CAI5724565.1 unnamed protein product [Hyaloperonospora brassicae]